MINISQHIWLAPAFVFIVGIGSYLYVHIYGIRSLKVALLWREVLPFLRWINTKPQPC